MKALVNLLKIYPHLDSIVIWLVQKGFFHTGGRQQRLGHEEPVDLRAVFISVLPMLHRGGGYF
eukprot:3998565-Amphidinium_carterae.1